MPGVPDVRRLLGGLALALALGLGSAPGPAGSANRFVGGPVQIPDRMATGDPTPVQSLEALVAEDQRVSAVAYRLAVANAELCEDIGPQWGMTLHSLAQYGPRLRPAVRDRFDIGGDVAVSTVVAEGPAGKAGLVAGDRIVAINGHALAPAAYPPARAAGSYRQVEAALALLAQSPEQGATLGVRRGDQVASIVITPRPGCAYDTQVTPGRDINASADGRHIFITSGFVSYAVTDPELALILGHELAHNVLHHRAQLDRTGFARRLLGNLGSSPANLARVEREADYVGLYLEARAGYDITVAEGFWRRMITDLGDPWYRRWSHPGSRERALNTRATVREIEDLIREGRPLVPRLDRPPPP